MIDAHLDAVKFQFTHPQGVRFSCAVQVVPQNVSIHAPARGAIGL